MLLTFSPIVTCLSKLQSENANVPIVVTVLGMVTDVSFLQEAKA